MRGDVCCHANGNTRRAVYQQVREARRQDNGLLQALVIVRLKIYRFLVKVTQQFHCRLVQASLGVTHCSCRIAVDRTKVAVAVNQRNTHGEWLRQTNHGVVHRRVAMRVILTDYVTNGTGGLSMGALWGDAAFIHRIQNAAMNRLQAVANIGKRARNNNAHRILEERRAHLFAKLSRKNVCCSGLLLVLLVCLVLIFCHEDSFCLVA